MATAGELENQIFHIEGFSVTIMQDGKDVRSDKGGFRDWSNKRQSKGNMTVSEWISKFQLQYPGYSVKILKGDGSVAYGNILLKNVRGSY